MTNLLLVVTRYFGGKKLGVGPLGKAYYTLAINVLEEVEKKERILFERIIVKMNISSISQLYRIISIYKGKVEKSNFKDDVVIEIIIQPKYINLLKNDLIELLSGKIEINSTGKQLYL